ncbi:MAG TPA: imidazoleglycerol-phosphate dehydratase HisB [Terricaulis sp.]|nr:imidazoleglycerol-phosphate dehydratase HisB [Terricaulis sp.]
MKAAPFAPLLPDGEKLQAFPERPDALIARMAAIYGVAPESVLPTQGGAQALALIARHAALCGYGALAGARADLARIAAVNRLALAGATDAATGAVIIASPDLDSAPLAALEIARRAREIAPALLVVDETLIEFEDAPSAAALIDEFGNLVVLRDLSYAYGLAGAPCAALLATPELIARLREAEEPGALAAPIVALAQAALAPHRVGANAARIAELRTERARLALAIPDAREGGGPFVWIEPADVGRARAAIGRFALEGEWRGAAFLLPLGAQGANDRAIAAFGGAPARAARRAEVVRDTKETQIVVRVDLDREGACEADTGIGFFDHMVAQIALHGGFELSLRCAGDLEVDGHHTIEDCALALGQALKDALGARKGLARFGFTLPMDEAEARVSVDLGGRPYLVFEGAFAASHIGAYPTEMTEHVFRSLAQSMGAAIHVHVDGANDHHKTEACYKAFGRALRQALRVEGAALPSTKGVI